MLALMAIYMFSCSGDPNTLSVSSSPDSLEAYQVSDVLNADRDGDSSADEGAGRSDVIIGSDTGADAEFDTPEGRNDAHADASDINSDVEPSSCGDGIIQAGDEACDHGISNGDYGACSLDCTGLGPHCGDGILQVEFEVCDEGPLNGQKGACRSDCAGYWVPLPPKDFVEPIPASSGLDCNEGDLLGKYLRYRRRLFGDGTPDYPGFVTGGIGPGHVLPAANRRPTVGCSNYWALVECPKSDFLDAHGMYKWGDGTAWLGHFVLALALEHSMYTTLGWDTSSTEQWLSKAFDAYERLDAGAEAYFGAEPALDGFFLRDDVPSGFEKDASGNYRFPRDDNELAGYECTLGDVSCEEPALDGGAFTSQDQVIHSVPGLATAAYLLPDSVEVGGVSLKSRAQLQLHRMVAHLRTNNWSVMAPNGESPPGKWGGNAIGFSNHLAKSANAVVGSTYGITDYRNASSIAAGEAAWVGLQAIWETTHFYNRTMALGLAAVTNDWDVDKMTRLAFEDQKEVFALLHVIFNQLNPSDDMSRWWIESWLSSAPCSGPCRDTAGCPNAPGWQTESRTFTPNDGLGSQHHVVFEGNGLDYMALFAAYVVWRGGVPGGEFVPAPSTCGDGALQAFAIAAPPDGTLWSPTDVCASVDLQQDYCGRPFSEWIQDAYDGRVTIFTNGAQWTCAVGQPCVLASNGATNTLGDDLIIGSQTDDELSGGGGNDCLVGLGGDDTLQGGQGLDRLEGGPGNDQLFGESQGWELSGEPDVLFGGDGDDLLDGGPGKDLLVGESGADTLDGGVGDDQLDGGAGNVILIGSFGDDSLVGGPGEDALDGGSDEDQLWGGPDKDKLDGGGGNDFLSGDEGPDFLRGGNGDDKLFGGDGVDHICGGGGSDIIWAGWDGDACYGGSSFLTSDDVNGCIAEPLSSSDCNSSAYDAW